MTNDEDDTLETALAELRSEDITRNEQTHPVPEDKKLWDLYNDTFRIPSSSRYERHRSIGRGPSDTPTSEELDHTPEDYAPALG
ncbi:MAG: hypothetical protein AAF449_00365, partial [Myxococcota bacterium]